MLDSNQRIPASKAGRITRLPAMVENYKQNETLFFHNI